MRKLLPILLVIVLVCVGMYAARQAQVDFGHHLTRQAAAVNRIVSLAPSITETVFALGAGDRLVGVTRYCCYPPEAKKIAKIGGYIDPNFEAIVRLKPDLVIVTVENKESAKKLTDLGLRVLTVNQNTIPGIIASITKIGHTIGADDRANKLVSGIQGRIDEVKRRTKGLNRPSVLISIGRSMGGGVSEIYVAGKNNFYDEIIGIAGGRNAYDSNIAKTPALSGEGITRLNPDIIIDLAPGKGKNRIEKSVGEWNTLSHVSAVKNNRVYTLTSDYVVVPGPRFIETLEDIARAIHPEIEWSRK
ncbi:MAG: cobalamin-binding protein [Armatimonadota bacterium]